MLSNRFSPGSKPELWGGLECTINRVGDHYYDQLSEAGYYDHPRMLDLVSTLHLKAFRFPIIWERHERIRGQDIDFTSAANGIKKLKSAGITPIVGLLHHGSGPLFTDLLDPDFSTKLQDYALKVAEAFPDVQYYTPINEPLTTARFSGLYGFWFPHSTEPLHFARMLLNQVKGIVLAMRAIRSVNPLAKLVQTEDLAKVYSTDPLNYQADFENVRRWISFDLLCGKVTQEHPMWQYLTSTGIHAAELTFFLDNNCPPDILGLNYYVTSERFLDHRCDLYPNEMAGTNGVHTYVDIPACRSTIPINLQGLLTEAWHRYQIPLAITEVHLACTREEQLRWFKEVWDTAQCCIDNGIEIRAVTAWSLFGAFDWDSLVTIRNHHYESGAFNVESYLRPTALAAMLKSIGSGEDYNHPVTLQRGWWRSPKKPEGKPLLVVCREGSFINGLVRICEHRRLALVQLSAETDRENIAELLAAVSATDPWGIVDALDMSDDTGDPRDDVQDTIVSRNLASISAITSIPYMIFARCASTPRTAPTAEKGHADLLAGSPIELLIASANPAALIIRTAHTFSPWDTRDFAFEIMHALRNERTLRVPTNVNIAPTYLPHLLNHALDLFIDMESGTWTLVNHHSPMTWSEFASNLAHQGGFSANRLIHGKTDRSVKPALASTTSRPHGRSVRMPNLHQAIEEYLIQLNN